MATGRIYTRACARDGKIERNLVRLHRDVDAALLLGRVLDLAFAEREQRVVLADADVFARVPFGAPLADDDVAGKNALAACLLDAEALSCGVAAVARGAACFLVCHLGLLISSAWRRASSPGPSPWAPASSPPALLQPSSLPASSRPSSPPASARPSFPFSARPS